ncbi:hypothetical protein HMPREF0185_03151 [Brevundimonas diminuta 470-4]|nr:hypothetical protein HMPREF0185_03151 [Brevundimonas diminuta 470-4]
MTIARFLHPAELERTQHLGRLSARAGHCSPSRKTTSSDRDECLLLGLPIRSWIAT